MANWSVMEREWTPNQYDPYQYGYNFYYEEKQPEQYQPPPPQAQNYGSPPSPGLTLVLASPELASSQELQLQYVNTVAPPKTYVLFYVNNTRYLKKYAVDNKLVRIHNEW